MVIVDIKSNYKVVWLKGVSEGIDRYINGIGYSLVLNIKISGNLVYDKNI